VEKGHKLWWVIIIATLWSLTIIHIIKEGCMDTTVHIYTLTRRPDMLDIVGLQLDSGRFYAYPVNDEPNLKPNSLI
jgi:hypothetical protein